MNSGVRHEGDRVWIEGTAGWSFREKQSSVHAAQEAVMQALGEDVHYSYLLGVSGLAFRMQLSEEGLCPSSPHSFCGFKCVARSVQALPWKVRILEIPTEKQTQVQEGRRAVTRSIDRGVPAQYGNEEDGIIVGYRKGGAEWICYHPFHGEGQPFIETEWPWGVVLFTERKEELPSRRFLALEALQQALDMATCGKTDTYFVGFEAWMQYIERLRALEEADEATLIALSMGNAWIYESLVRSRAHAAIYLREVANELPPAAASSLSRAADLYQEMSAEMLSDARNDPRAIAPYPAMLKRGADWTSQMRRDQVLRLERALGLERQALDAIREGLALAAGEPEHQ
jgi:hypothetical protein